MSKWFTRYPCEICGRMISNCGFAYTAHADAHERRGETKENYKAKTASNRVAPAAGPAPGEKEK